MAICNRRGGKRPGAGRPKHACPSRRVSVPAVYADIFEWLCRQDEDTLCRLIEGQDATVSLRKALVMSETKRQICEARYKNLREHLVKAAVREFNSATHDETRQAINRIIKA